MQDQQTPENTPPESPYAPWANLIIEICDDQQFYPVEVIRSFWDKYTLPECTLPLYQLLMSMKSRAAQADPANEMLPHPIEEETLNTWFRDLCGVIIAFSYLTRFAPEAPGSGPASLEQIIFVKPKTSKPDAKH